MENKQTLSISYLLTVVQALFVTVLWSSSWVIIKFGLKEIPPLIFSGLRYTLASVVLLSIIFVHREYRDYIMKIDQKKRSLLLIYGLVFISVTQGTMYFALNLLPAITVSFALSCTVIIVLILSNILLKETPSKIQIFFIFISFIGTVIYFTPLDITNSEFIGLIVISIGVIANALATILGRSINRELDIPPVVITGISMFFGSIALLFLGFVVEGLPTISVTSFFYIIWLSIVNTAFAFTLWNKTMQKLRAIDSTLINNTMLPQIVILAMIFLSETPTILESIGLIILLISVTIIQLNQAKQESKKIINK